MNRHHKWFRKERYKQKLERDVNNHKTYFSNVYFTTDEPDPRDLRENIHLISWAADFHDISIEEATKRYIEREKSGVMVSLSITTVPRCLTLRGTTTKRPDAVSTKSSSKR